MPRPKQGARLWLRRERTDPKTGKRISNSQWYIKDGNERVATGCHAGEVGNAEEKLAAYIAAKYAPERKIRDIESIDVADVLSVYDEDKRERIANKPKHDERMTRLTLWWGGKMLSEVSGKTCRAYAASRKTPGGARRDLEDLRASIRHHSKEGSHRGEVGVWLPEKGAPRDRWLTRDEAARLIWACWRAQEHQRRWRGPNKGKVLPTSKRPLRHVARFILLGLYTGTRAAAIASASPTRGKGRSYVDLENGIFYRLAGGQRVTKKRQTPVPLPPHLLSHMRRWAKPDANGNTPDFFVEWAGKPVASVKKAFAHAASIAGLGDDVTPHTLRHTAATWLMQNGVPIWEAAGFLGMSPELVERTYGHHHPDHLKAASRGFRPRNGGGNGGDSKEGKT